MLRRFSLKKLLKLTLFFAIAIFLNCGEKESPSVSIYDVVWDSPSENSAGSMPLGNGDIGINVWAEKSGDLFCYIGKTDTWGSGGQLLKLGKIRIQITPNPFIEKFKQQLDLKNGEIHIKAGNPPNQMNISIRVDANNPVIHFDLESEQYFEIETHLELWRTKVRELTGNEKHTVYGVINSPNPIIVYPDSVLETNKDELVWVHQNPTSIWDVTLDRQGMGFWKEEKNDPLLNNTFGGLIKGENLKAINNKTLKSTESKTGHSVSIYALTAQVEQIEEWQNQLNNLVEKVEKQEKKEALQDHQKFWNEFWQRSWIHVDGSEDAKTVSHSFVLQRFISACAGRGNFPQKFNGSLFTVDSLLPDFSFNADYRRWGGPYWLQNTRLIYWPMLQNGDFDMMRPFFEMYLKALNYAEVTTQHFYGHGGAFFPETMYFWGSYNLDNFGWDTPINPFKHTKNRYIRYYYQGALEAAAIMLDFYRYTENEEFAKNYLLPFAHKVTQFYDEHYLRDENGKIFIHPSQALETYWEASNPMPPIAGLHWNVNGILKLPNHLFTEDQWTFFQKIAKELPDIPMWEKDGKEILLPAEFISGEPRNHENPEFYAVFPYRLFGVGKPELERVKNNFEMARVKVAKGWQHYDVNAAFLGLTEEAKKLLVNRTNDKNTACRFPAFWGPNYDWIPDQDHGSNILIALQAMLLQTNERKLILFPAWPKEWDVQFKLHAPGNTTIEGELKGGELIDLNVTPKHRKKDLEIIKLK